MKASDRGLSLLLEQVVRLVYDRSGPGDLHPVQWAALRYYERAGRLTRTVAGLSCYLGITKGPASRTTSRLLRRGYLSAETNESDRRAPLISLTDKGRAALKDDPILRLAEAIGGLNEDRKSTFAAGLEQIYQSILGAAEMVAEGRTEAT